MVKVMNYDIVFVVCHIKAFKLYHGYKIMNAHISFFHFKFSDTSGVEGAIESDLIEILSSTLSAADTSESDIQ